MFSITNNLTTGSIFSVNDVSGIPSIDVDADGTVALTPFGGNIGVGLTNPTQKLDVNGAIRLRSTLYDVNNQVGAAASVLVSTGAGVSWTSPVPTGGGTDKVFYLNDNTVTTSYTIPENKNAMSAGPITISVGATVSISTGSNWVVVI